MKTTRDTSLWLDKQSGRIVSTEEMLDMVDADDNLDSFIKLENTMKTTTSVTANSLLAMAVMNPMGFTIDTNGIEVTKFYTRYVIGLEITKDSHNLEGAEHCIAVMNELLESGNYERMELGFGGWLDTKTNLFHFDVVMFSLDITRATLLGRMNKQIAIFDLETMNEVRL